MDEEDDETLVFFSCDFCKEPKGQPKVYMICPDCLKQIEKIGKK